MINGNDHPNPHCNAKEYQDRIQHPNRTGNIIPVRNIPYAVREGDSRDKRDNGADYHVVQRISQMNFIHENTQQCNQRAAADITYNFDIRGWLSSSTYTYRRKPAINAPRLSRKLPPNMMQKQALPTAEANICICFVLRGIFSI